MIVGNSGIYGNNGIAVHMFIIIVTLYFWENL